MPGTQTFTDVQPISQTFTDVTPIAPPPSMPIPEAPDVMAARAYSGEHPIKTILFGNPHAQPVNEQAMFSSSANAPLPLQIAQGALGAMAPGSAAMEAVPSAERAGNAFQAVSKAIGDKPVVATQKMADALSDMKQGIDTGLNAPAVVNKLMTRMADLEEGPLTYTEARQFYSNMGDLAASDKMAANAKMQRLIYQLQHSLGDSIANTAEQGGQLPQYKGAMSEFSNAKRLQEVGSNAATAAKKAAIPALLGAGGVAAYKTYQDILGR